MEKSLAIKIIISYLCNCFLFLWNMYFFFINNMIFGLQIPKFQLVIAKKQKHTHKKTFRTIIITFSTSKQPLINLNSNIRQKNLRNLDVKKKSFSLDTPIKNEFTNTKISFLWLEYDLWKSFAPLSLLWWLILSSLNI